MQNEKTPSYIKVGIMTIITTVFWIGFSVYRTLTTKPTPNVPAPILAPFNPNLDTAKVSEIQSRISFEEGQIQALTVPTPTPTPILSPSPSPTSAPTATPTPEGGVIP